ncbi:MAG: helix-turn-helix transcriptional regulator [Polyangiaceae bacterium]|nr:helix-turn-helix transcriptional regulator [Polyangiaceae bacterium]
MSKSKVALWRRRSHEVLTSDVVASRNPGPQPTPAWAQALKQLTALSRAPTPAPSWWTPATAFFGSVETRTDPASYHWDGMKRLGRKDPPLFFFQFTLAGWGHFELYGQPPRQVPAGTGFFAMVPSRHRYYLPEGSPGWTFGWFGIYHPYLLARVGKQVGATGPLVETPPEGALTASALRLVRGAIKKDFRDRYEVELALFDFVLSYERWAHQASDRSGERQRVLDEVRARIVAGLPQATRVDALAADYGMSRSHFSHFFRVCTGLTPARFAAEVRIHQATRMLLDTRAPLKQIADACGFANANHLCKVFRRFQHLSPASYRKSVR